MYKKQLLFVFLFAAVCSNDLLAQEIQGMRVAQTRIGIGIPLQIQIDFSNSNTLNPNCGLEINFGDGNTSTVRVGANGPQDLPLKLTHSYKSPGQYALRVEGKGIFRGLKSVLGCGGSVAQLTVTAFDEAAEKAKEDAIKAQQAAEQAKADAIREQQAAEVAKEAAIREQKAAEMAKDAAIKERNLAAKEAELRRLAASIEREQKLQTIRERQLREQELKHGRHEGEPAASQSQRNEPQPNAQTLQANPKSNAAPGQTKAIDGF